MNKKNAQPEKIQPGTQESYVKYTAPAPSNHEDAIYAAALATFGARKLRRIAAAMQRWETRKGRGCK